MGNRRRRRNVSVARLGSHVVFLALHVMYVILLGTRAPLPHKLQVHVMYIIDHKFVSLPTPNLILTHHLAANGHVYSIGYLMCCKWWTIQEWL